MFDFIQRLIYSVLALQEKVLKKKIKGNINAPYANSMSKKKIIRGASFELTAQTEKNKLKLENDVKIILKKYENNPQKLLEFVQNNGTKVYKIPFANRILKLIGYEEGFVIATEGIKSLYINIIAAVLAGEKMKLSLKSEPVFILRGAHFDDYYLIQHFHKWYAMKLNLPGFDPESQDNFQKYLTSSDLDIKSLNIEEILGLKEAIARDKEAINFIINFAKSTAGSKNALKKMLAGGASI